MGIQNQKCSRFMPLFAVIALTGFSNCSRSVKSTGGEIFNQKEPPPVVPTTPSPRPSSKVTPSPIPTRTPTPTPTLKPSPSPSPTPSPKESPIPCDKDALQFLNNNGVVSAGPVTGKGFRVSHGIIGTQILLNEAEIGYGLGREWDRYDLIGTDLDLKWTEIVSGSAAYEKTNRVREGTTISGRYVKAKPFDSPAFFASIDRLRTRASALPLNGKITRVCNDEDGCTTRLTGTHSTLNRFDLDPTVVGKRERVEIVIPEKATAVVFLKGTSWNWDDLSIEGPNETVWFAPKSMTKVSLSWLTLPGTLFAPEADIQLEQILIMGRVISKSLNTSECRHDYCVTVDSQERINQVCL